MQCIIAPSPQIRCVTVGVTRTLDPHIRKTLYMCIFNYVHIKKFKCDQNE